MVKNSLFAEPAVTVNEVLLAPVSPVDEAVSVYVPGALMTRLLKVATPFTAFTVRVPRTAPAGDDAIVTEAEEPVIGSPRLSVTLTTTGLNVAAAVVEAGGCVVKSSLLAGPVPIVIEVWTEKPPDHVAVSV